MTVRWQGPPNFHCNNLAVAVDEIPIEVFSPEKKGELYIKLAAQGVRYFGGGK